MLYDFLTKKNKNKTKIKLEKIQLLLCIFNSAIAAAVAVAAGVHNNVGDIAFIRQFKKKSYVVCIVSAR